MANNESLREGILYYDKGNYTAALTFFLSLPEDADTDPIEIAYYLGLCYAKLNRYDDAMLYLEQVVTSKSKDSDLENRILQCRYLLAVIYCLSGRKKLADFELNKLLETGYKKSQVFSSLAYIAWEQGNVNLSIEYYEKSLEEDENNATALNGFAYVLACNGTDLTRALTMAKRALNYFPESPAFLDTMGWIYFQMGLNKEAKEFLDKALYKDPNNDLIKSHYSDLQKVTE